MIITPINEKRITIELDFEETNIHIGSDIDKKEIQKKLEECETYQKSYAERLHEIDKLKEEINELKELLRILTPAKIQSSNSEHGWINTIAIGHYNINNSLTYHQIYKTYIKADKILKECEK